MTVGRTRPSSSALLAALLTGAFALTTLHGAAPAAADPGSELKTAKQKVEALDVQAEAASERYNAARLRLAESQTRLKALESDVTKQQTVVDGLRDDIASLLVSQYQGNPLSAASQVVFSDDSQAFIDNLSAASSYSSQQSEVIDEYQVQLKRLQLRKAAAKDQVAALTRTRKVLADSKSTIDEKAAGAQEKFDDLSAKARAAMTAGYTGDLSAFDFSGRAAPVLKYAMAQVGKPYVWGAMGPGSFDCSGLTMAAWSQAGVGLPHSSRAQMGSGRPVSKSDLQPGDLVFFYSPVSHVGLYIGNGMIVNAQNPRSDVSVTRVDSMPYSGAVRP